MKTVSEEDKTRLNGICKQGQLSQGDLIGVGYSVLVVEAPQYVQ